MTTNSLIRPQILIEDIKFRGENISKKSLRNIKKALLTFHNLESMAVNIYRFQITKKKSELNRLLIASMCNEMTHLQDFQIKLFEYGWHPGKLRIIYLLLGMILGIFSRLFGERSILKIGIWVESKAVHHYETLLNSIDWDNDSLIMIKKNQQDENEHIIRWKNKLKNYKIQNRRIL